MVNILNLYCPLQNAVLADLPRCLTPASVAPRQDKPLIGGVYWSIASLPLYFLSDKEIRLSENP